MYTNLSPGDLVWFDPGVGYVLPGEVIEYHESAKVVMVQAIINSSTKNFTLNNLSSVRPRQDLGQNGVEDMITLRDINEASVLWNLRLRYDNANIYTYIGTILISVNPYRGFDTEDGDIYGIKSVTKYDGQILGTLPPHLFAIGSAALARQVAYPKKNVVLLLNGESGSGKTECSKLLLQYLSAVNKSSSNLITEQILEGSNLIESFGHARTLTNNNSSRFGKFIQIFLKDGVISGAKFNDYLLDKHRIVSHNSDERNFHIFYELLAGLSKEQKEKFGLMTADKYFYLNQGRNYDIDGKNDKADFGNLISSLQVLGFSLEERDNIFKVVAAILHLGNVYFNRKHFRNGVEGVELGSSVEIKWLAHLLQLNSNAVAQMLTSKSSYETPRDPIVVPMNIDQALDVRDALSKALYASLFSWIIKRMNKILSNKSKKNPNQKGICIYDVYGFEDLNENSFEQLCINFANEHLHNVIIKRIFKAEQAEYANEQIEWTPINYSDNGPILNILCKKPVGIFHLLDDESNFPKANDTSFLDKCHYNHALNELYSRPRMSSREFGVKHFAGQVWYNVDGFLKKNRDLASGDILSLLCSTKDRRLLNIFSRLNPKNIQNENIYNDPRNENGHLISMKPRAATVSARFIDNLHHLHGILNESYPFYVLCIKPNPSKLPSKFDMPLVLEQIRVNALVETIMIRKTGYPIRMKYKHFVERFRCLLGARYPSIGYYGGGSPTTKEMARNIVEKFAGEHGADFEFGSSKVFLKENLRKTLETERRQIHDVTVIKLQRAIRGYLARKDFINKKKSTIKLQAAYRGWSVRKDFNKAKKGVIALQAIYRMKKQRSIYLDIKKKIEEKRQIEEEEALERRKRRAQKAEAKMEERLIHIERARLAKRIDEDPLKTMSSKRDASSSRMTSPSSRKTFDDFDEFDEEAEEDLDHEFTMNEEKAAEKSNAISLREMIRRKASSKPTTPPGFRLSPSTSQRESPSQSTLEIPAELAFIMSKMDKIEMDSTHKNLGKIMEPLSSTPFYGSQKLPSDIDYYSFSKVANIYFKHHLWESRREPIKTPFLSKAKDTEVQDSLALFKMILRFMNEPNQSGVKDKVLSDYIINKGIKNEKLRDEIYCQLANQTHKNQDARSNDRAWFLMSNCLSTFPPSKTLYKYLLKYISDDAVNGYKYICQQKLLQNSYFFESRLYPTTNLEWRSNKKRVNMALDATFPDFEMRPVAVNSFTTAEEFAANALSSRSISEITGWSVAFEMGDDLFELNGSDYVLDVIAERELPSVFPKSKLPFLRVSGSIERKSERAPMPLPVEEIITSVPIHKKMRSKSEDILNGTEDLGLAQNSILNNRYFESKEEARSKSLDNLLNSNNYGLSENSRLNQRYHDIFKAEDDTKSEWQDIPQKNDRYFSTPDLLEMPPPHKNSKEASKHLTMSSDNLKLTEELEMAIAGGAVNPQLLKKGRPRFVKGRRNHLKHSSALSDTSEAPSIASHVRRVRVPSQASDVDQFLDDLFMPVLDVEDAGLSDAKSLAASMKGGGAKKFKKLTVVDDLVTSIRGSRETEEGQPQQAPAMGFQPIPGLVSPTMSPPPMLIPTPLQGTSAQATPSLNQDGSALAFTYVPVPVYNLGGMSLQGGMITPKMNEEPNNPPNSMMGPSYQQAFIQNAVAQNMQIQQQLMLQNQALSQLLSQASPQPGSLSSAFSELKVQQASQASHFEPHQKSTPSKESQKLSSSPKGVPSMDMDLSGIMDPYMRARTVRIGKWRWPPPKEELVSGEGSQNEGFFEFKLRKLQEKQLGHNGSHITPNFFLEDVTQEMSKKNEGQEMQNEAIDGKGYTGTVNKIEYTETISEIKKSPLEEENQRLEWEAMNGSIHKIKLSKEVKNRLEAAVINGRQPNEDTDKLALSELEMQEIDENGRPIYQQVGKVLDMQHRPSESEKKTLKKWTTVEGVDRAEAPEDTTDSHSAIPLPPPLPFVFPGSLSTKTGEKLTAKYGTEDFFDSTVLHKNMPNMPSPPPSPIPDFHEDDYQSVDEVRTKLHPPNSDVSYTYTRNVPWSLNIRKECFSPSETLSNPLVIHLIFTQIARDILTENKISQLRLGNDERLRLRTLLDEYSINLDNLGSTKHRLHTKKNIIDVAKTCNYYFTRLYPISSGIESESQFLCVSHKGVSVVRQVQGPQINYLEAIESYSFEDIGEISTIKSSGLQIVTHTGGRLLASSPKAETIKELLNTYLIEANAGHYDYVKALGDYKPDDEGSLAFKKGDIIAIVPKKDPYTEKGWLYGLKEGSYGLIPGDFVTKLSPKSIRREMRIIANVTTNNRGKESGHHETEEEEEEVVETPPRGTDDDEEDEKVPLIVPIDKPGQVVLQHQQRRSRTEAHPIPDDGKHPLLEFALQHFQDSFKMRADIAAELSSSSSSDKKSSSKKKTKGSKKSPPEEVPNKDWTWKDQVGLVKWTPNMISSSLLRLEAPGHNNLALECFACIMRVMGDLPLLANQHEVDCVNTLLMYCHRLESIRDEVYCQIMKQTTNNKSHRKDSCQKGWRLFTIVAAYFSCTEVLKPFLFKYLETSAYDKRRAYHGTALVCLQNLRKTFKYGGRKNVPSIEEITAIVAGRSSKRQIYRLPGGTEKIINTKSTTVVADIIDELCNFIGVKSESEKEEFSLYCIIEGELYTLPLSNRHYILDLTNGLQHQNEDFYLIFCRSVWHYPLRKENPLYIEVVFNQIAPDYLEGHLLVMTGGLLAEEETVAQISKVAALLHRAADMNEKPSIKETKFLLPKPLLSSREIKPPAWVHMVQSNWKDIEHLSSGEAKAGVLQILSDWPLFGSSFFAVTRVSEGVKNEEDIEEELLALNKHGVSFLDQITHETLLFYSFSEVISTRKVEIDETSLYLDMKCGNLMSQKITRIKTFQADEIARLIRQYISIDQKLKGSAPSLTRTKMMMHS